MTAIARHPLIVLSLIGFLLSADGALITVLVEPMKRDIALSDIQIGLLQGTAYGLAYGLSAFPMGRLIDRVNRLWALAIGLVIWMAALALTASAHGIAMLIGSRIALGMVAALLVPASLSLIADFFPVARRSWATSMFAVGQTIGGASGIFAGGLIYDVLNRATTADGLLNGIAAWRVIFLGAALLGVPFVFLLTRLHEPARSTTAEKGEGLGTAFRNLIAQRRLLLPLLVGLLFVQLAMQASGIWIPPVLMRRFGLQPGAFAVWLSPVFLGGGILGSLVAGRVGDWSMRRSTSGTMLAVAGLASLIMAPLSFFALGYSPLQFGVLLACYMTTGALIMTLGVVAITIFIPAEIRGLALGANMFTSTMFGTAAAPVAVASLSKYLGGEGHLSQALVITSFPSLVAGGICFFIAYRSMNRDNGPAPSTLATTPAR